MGGFKIGVLKRIESIDQQLVFEVEIDAGVRIPSDSEFSVDEKDLLGDIEFKVQFGDSKRFLQSTDTVQILRVSKSDATVDSIKHELKSKFKGAFYSYSCEKLDSVLIELQKLNKRLDNQESK